MADCTYWEYRISLALDGELDPAGREELARHLDACPRCRQVRDAWAESARALRDLPDLADAALLAGLLENIHRKVPRHRPHPGLAWAAAAVLALFAAANVWLGPLWQRPVLVAAMVKPENRLELTFNQNMSHWSTGASAGVANGPMTGATVPAPRAGTSKSMAIQPPQEAPPRASRPLAQAPAYGSNRAVPQEKAAVPPPYTVTRRGRTLIFSFAGPLPPGPVRILVPATVRDTWGRELGRAYLIVINHGKVTVKAL